MHSLIIKTPPFLPNFNPNINHINSNNHNSSFKLKPISQIDKIVQTHFSIQPNVTLNLTNPMNKSRIPSKPISQINQIVKTHFQNPSNLTPSLTKPFNKIKKIQFLSAEFKALPEPIDRVKRLLHYASLLSPILEPGRIDSNRVTGCTTQVWLEAKIDSKGLMRYKADSDSEITKGFCYCLIWALNGVKPDEVMSVEAEDFAEMNVGFSGRSRVNTWQNVLVAMKRRTEALAEERGRGERLEGFPGFYVEVRDFPEKEEKLLGGEVAHLS